MQDPNREAEIVAQASLDDLLWLLNQAGPSLLRPANSQATSRDESGSGYGFRFAVDCVKNGLSLDGYLAKISEDDREAGEWAARADERQQKRAYDKARTIVQDQKEALLDLFPGSTDELIDGWAPAPTEVCAAEVFAREYRDQLKYNVTEGAWYCWNGWCWQKDERGLARQAMLDVCKRIDQALEKGAKSLLKSSAMEGALRIAASQPGITSVSAEWNRNADQLATPIGTVNLKTGNIQPAVRSDLISKGTPHEPIPLSKFDVVMDCPNWMVFLLHIANGDYEVVEFLQRWFGYCLTGHTREQKFVFIHGCGGSGKSTLVLVLSMIGGDYAIEIDTEVLTQSKYDRHPTSIARMDGARIVAASETKEGRKWDQQLLKQLTGGDPVVARRMRQDEFQFSPKLKLSVVGNKRPSMTSVETAMERRMIVIEMNQVPEKPDPNLLSKLESEASGILSWAIEGAANWYQSGLLVPQSIKASTEEYLYDQDIFQQWIDACCELEPNAKEPFPALWASMSVFCEKNRFYRFTKNDFVDALNDRKFAQVQNVGTTRSRGRSGLQIVKSPEDFEEISHLLAEEGEVV